MVAGASGLVGREVLAALSTDRHVQAIHLVGRRLVSHPDPRVQSHAVDFAALGELPAVDEVYIALGTTIRVAGSQQAFRAIDFDAVLAVATQALRSGARRLGVVSAMGADPQSGVFYNRVKGEAEEALKALGYSSLVIARPSLLDGDRDALGQQARPGERVGLALARWLKPAIPANYRAVRARDVALSLIDAVQQGEPGCRVLLSGDLQRG